MGTFQSISRKFIPAGLALLVAAAVPAMAAPLVQLNGGQTSVVLSQDFVDALGEAGTAPGSIAPGSITGGVASFPIPGGALDAVVPYRPNRAVVFPSSLVHCADAPSKSFPGLRVSLAYKLLTSTSSGSSTR